MKRVYLALLQRIREHNLQATAQIADANSILSAVAGDFTAGIQANLVALEARGLALQRDLQAAKSEIARIVILNRIDDNAQQRRHQDNRYRGHEKSLNSAIAGLKALLAAEDNLEKERLAA